MKQYQSSIKLDKVKIAQAGVDRAKETAKKNVIEMSENVGLMRDGLLVDAQEINVQARKF